MEYDPSPMGYHNPCFLHGRNASFSVGGRTPDRTGGGVLFWAYSREEAEAAALAYKNAGYHDVSIYIETK